MDIFPVGDVSCHSTHYRRTLVSRQQRTARVVCALVVLTLTGSFCPNWNSVLRQEINYFFGIENKSMTIALDTSSKKKPILSVPHLRFTIISKTMYVTINNSHIMDNIIGDLKNKNDQDRMMRLSRWGVIKTAIRSTSRTSSKCCRKYSNKIWHQARSIGSSRSDLVLGTVLGNIMRGAASPANLLYTSTIQYRSPLL